MRTQDYLDQNAKGYEGDSFIGLEIAKLVQKFAVKVIIETGTYLGNTTKKLVKFAPVYTVEINEANFNSAKENLGALVPEMVVMKHGNSVDALIEWMPRWSDLKEQVLLFLDAHWNDYCPLLDELKVIAENGLKPVIVIHDWKVPGRPDLGFDSYKGQDYTFEWIQESIEKIYGVDGYAYHYNDEAEGAKRGVIYIYPKN